MPDGQTEKRHRCFRAALVPHHEDVALKRVRRLPAPGIHCFLGERAHNRVSPSALPVFTDQTEPLVERLNNNPRGTRITAAPKR